MDKQEIRTRCTQGVLVIDDTAIRVELGQLRQQVIMRSAFTGVESRQGVASFFGLGGGTNLVFHGQGLESIHANLVKPAVAREIVSLLTKK